MSLFSPRLASLLLALLLLSCGGNSAIRLILIASNDVHGALESTKTDRATGRPVGGAAFFAAEVARIRAENEGRVILLDAGDAFQGAAISNLLGGRPVVEVMNRIAYDAAVIGNHEFDWGIPILRDRIDDSRFPWLGANVRERGTGMIPSWLRPYTIVERAGLRIALIGLITEDTPMVTLPSQVETLRFLEAAPEAQRWIDRLLPDSADAAVLLVHIGGRSVDGRIEGPIADLAWDVKGEAAVLGGHTHSYFADFVDGTPLVMAGSRLAAYSRIDLLFDAGSRRVIGAEPWFLPLFADSIEADTGVAGMIERFRKEGEPILDRVLGRAATDLEVSRSECPVGNLLCDAVREGLDLDMALHNPGGVRAAIPCGEITYAMVYEVMPFDNTVFILRLTGGELEEALVQAAETVSLLHASGLSYTIDRRGAGRPAIVDMRDGEGRPVGRERTYRVGINSFMAEGGDGLTLLSGRPGAVDTGVMTRDLLTRYIETRSAVGKEVTAKVEGRVRVLR